jgi:hypothetical protein
MLPRRKISGLVVITSIRHDHLAPYRHNFGFVEDDSAVVESCLVQDRAPHIDDDIVSYSRNKDILYNVPRVKNSVVLQKVILTTIARYFQFTTDSNRAVESFALLNAFHDLLIVFFEVERVIVETTETHLDIELSELHWRRKMKSNNISWI